jgi:hypothetical protein
MEKLSRNKMPKKPSTKALTFVDLPAWLRMAGPSAPFFARYLFGIKPKAKMKKISRTPLYNYNLVERGSVQYFLKKYEVQQQLQQKTTPSIFPGWLKKGVLGLWFLIKITDRVLITSLTWVLGITFGLLIVFMAGVMRPWNR